MTMLTKKCFHWVKQTTNTPDEALAQTFKAPKTFLESPWC